MSNPNRIYFLPKPGDTNSFGSSVVVNDKYLAIGDPRAKKVIIYTPDDSGKWSRTREIRPPVNVAFDGIDSIFGSSLDLDEDILTISARIRNPDVSRDGLSPTQAARTPPTYSHRRYLINLKIDIELQPIDLLVQREPESNLVRFNLLRQGKIEQFVLPDMGAKHLGSNESSYSSMVALHESLLLVGYYSVDNTGGAWLFDLDRPQVEPLKLAIEDTALGSTVAISQQFAAVGSNGHNWYFPQGGIRDRSHKTPIRNLKNGSTTVIDSFGELSFSGDILAIMRPCNPQEEIAGLLEVFRIDEDTKPHLIRRTNVAKAKVQNGFLITLKTYYRVRLCIEPLF
ncbi:MAG: hypothetical protein ACRC2R_07165 [Xenococcaceae cyanobacterium]